MLVSKLAPGTSGNFTISIDATGTQVGIKYMINSIEETDKPRNLKFFFEDKKFNSLKQMEKYLTGTISANDNNKTRTLKINWEWKFETGDTEDEIVKNNIKLHYILNF